jgi:Tol biopolymer transport system component
MVVKVDVQSGTEELLTRGRQLGWGQPTGEIVPVYGPHWDPGEHRDLELLNVRTGKTRTVVTADAVREAYGSSAYAETFRELFGDRTLSVFFPILSPDGNRVFFKLSTPAGGGFRNSSGSKRYGILCYDLQQERFLYTHPKWGHPAWHPDSRRIINMWGQGPVLVDVETGNVERNPELPPFAGGHPAVSPDGQLFVTDTRVDSPEGSQRLWAIAVGDFSSGGCVILHRFDNSQGAKSWRRAHPHPVFSPDGRRIYFNVNSGRWTRLFVAECSPAR